MNKKNDIHGGNPSAIAAKLELKCSPEILYDFSVNINPFGMPDAVERAIAGMRSSDYSNYPEIYAEHASEAVAEAHNIPTDSILLGNGSTELFSWIIQAISPKKAHCIAPCYSGYSEICRAAGKTLEIAKYAKPEDDFKITLKDIEFKDIELIFLASPNNPTGVTIPKSELLDTARKNSGTFFVVDESFTDFLPDQKTLLAEKELPANIAIVKSLTKFFAIAGVRLGMLYAVPETVAKFAEKRLPWSVNAVAQKIAPLLYIDNEYICETRTKICELRKQLSANLANCKDIKVFPASADFILCQTKNVPQLQKYLMEQGILIRNCSDISGLDNSFFRIAVRTEKENTTLLNAIQNYIKKSADSEILTTGDEKTMQPLMVVGTTSDAGKSVVTAALCRHFARKGVKVAPFKAQNMSLNSFVTKEGGEMGRAQVVQAEAAGIEPHTDMNPVLLKPTGDSGSQLILNGKPLCNVTARSYYEEKCELRKDAQAAYDRLAARFDMIIIEGAGSPAEINLQKEDFVNMAMAEYANAKTILVADINPGGVFASIYGTVKLIPQRYRKYLCGVIINKFRGDVSLLKGGIDEIEKLTGIPVLGVLPYIENLDIEEEDSMSLDSKSKLANLKDSNLIDIAVIRLPRISNFTDFLPLETMPGVSLRYISNPAKMGNPDLVIIPGSKNTIADMKFLRESGFESRIKNLRTSQTPIFGICGGLQMLGSRINDPDGIEGDCSEIRGLELLPIETILTENKKLTQIKGTISNLPFSEAGIPFKGYEIHAGRTAITDKKQIGELKESTSGQNLGYVSEDSNVMGTYIHGLFDSSLLCIDLIKWLASKNPAIGSYIPKEREPADKNQTYNRLADILEKYVDLDLIQRAR
jgi:cobyric acid synthase CobQ/L-threonine-O-3-phosphate decarboxylase